MRKLSVKQEQDKDRKALILTECNIVEAQINAAISAMQDAINAGNEALERVKEIRKGD